VLSSAPPGLELNEVEVDEDGLTISGETAHLEASDGMQAVRPERVSFALPLRPKDRRARAEALTDTCQPKAPMVASALVVD
jgi:hypothetical protein